MNINVQEPYFSHILSGEKTVEGRLNKGKFLEIKPDDILEINNIARFRVVQKNTYKTFREMILVEGVRNVIPDKKIIDEAVQFYYKFYTKEDENKFGVVAIKIEKIK